MLHAERLREFRSSLITAAVTGQFDFEAWGRRGETHRRLDKIEEDMAELRNAGTGGGASMNISAKTIERLVDIITGNSEKSPYRSGPLLIEFFRDFGERDLYGQGFPSRASYVQVKLRKFNGMETMEKIVSAAFDFFR